jgi:uncharacterized membrane protein
MVFGCCGGVVAVGGGCCVAVLVVVVVVVTVVAFASTQDGGQAKLVGIDAHKGPITYFFSLLLWSEWSQEEDREEQQQQLEKSNLGCLIATDRCYPSPSNLTNS